MGQNIRRREDNPEAGLDDLIEAGELQMAAPREVGEGTIIAYPDMLSLDPQVETARDVKERPWMRVDPTPPGTRIGDDDNAFPFAYRQGVYVALSSSNQGGESVEVPPTAFNANTGRVSLKRGEPGYALPWGWATIDTNEARPIIGRADVGTVKKVRGGIARVLKGTLGAGNVSSGGGRRGGR